MKENDWCCSSLTATSISVTVFLAALCGNELLLFKPAFFLQDFVVSVFRKVHFLEILAPRLWKTKENPTIF